MLIDNAINCDADHTMSVAASKSIVKMSSPTFNKNLPLDSKSLVTADACSCIRFELPKSSSRSLSTLTSFSESMQAKVKDSTSANPSTNKEYLRDCHKRAMRKRKLIKCIKTCHCIVTYGLPIGGITLGITSIILGHFLEIEPLFVAGCLLLIAAVGLMLQSCFWSRSFPNRFRAKEIAFNMPPEDSLVSKSNEPSEDGDIATDSGNTAADASIKSPGVKSEQVRRLSMALNRVTAELSAARQISTTATSSGVLNLTRRLTMVPMAFGSYMDSRDLESGNGWVAGRAPHGVRRGLAWNDTGAARFYASNYD